MQPETQSSGFMHFRFPSRHTDWNTYYCRQFPRLPPLAALPLAKFNGVNTQRHINAGGASFGWQLGLGYPVALQLAGAIRSSLRIVQSWRKRVATMKLTSPQPSDRVQNGMFGARLMGNAQLVADCVKSHA